MCASASHASFLRQAVGRRTGGPSFVSTGQLLSTRPDLLPVPFTEALARLQDKVAPFPFEEVEKIVSSELGMRFSRAFSLFDPVPISALGEKRARSKLKCRPAQAPEI